MGEGVSEVVGETELVEECGGELGEGEEGAKTEAEEVFCVFQAEDGIRDSGVTGVQTWALPISDPPDVNEAVVRDARARGVLVSRADAEEGEPADFTTPALFRDGPVTVTVSAGGNPAMAAFARDRTSAVLGKADELGGRRSIKKQ